MIQNEKFKIQTAGKKITLKGIIDEDADFSSLKNLSGQITINFKEVTSINSLGIRTWVNFLKQVEQSEISFEECPPIIVRQMNMVPSFVGKSTIKSVFVPYVCEECESEKLVKVESNQFSGGKISVQESMPCTSCKKGEMELDGNPKQYFAFAK
jgi:anti-anti-sigma regulatory factor